MKTVTTKKIVSHVAMEKFGYWKQPDKDDDGEFVAVRSATECQAMAEYLGVSIDTIDAMMLLFEGLRDACMADLNDIWKRLEI